MAVALIVPLTYFLSPLAALAAVVTLEACAISAGDIPSALVRIPGTPASAAYADDLYQLAQRGHYQRALGVCIDVQRDRRAVRRGRARPVRAPVRRRGHLVHGRGVLLALRARPRVRGGRLARLGPQGRASPCCSASSSRPSASAPCTRKRASRSGGPELYQGISFIPALVGLFGLSEVLRNVRAPGPVAARHRWPRLRPRSGRGSDRSAPCSAARSALFRRRPRQTLLASAIGTLIGILPGAGADIAAWVSYGVSKRDWRRTRRSTGAARSKAWPTPAPPTTRPWPGPGCRR